jgi:hypothetical protein
VRIGGQRRHHSLQIVDVSQISVLANGSGGEFEVAAGVVYGDDAGAVVAELAQPRECVGSGEIDVLGVVACGITGRVEGPASQVASLDCGGQPAGGGQ